MPWQQKFITIPSFGALFSGCYASFSFTGSTYGLTVVVFSGVGFFLPASYLLISFLSFLEFYLLLDLYGNSDFFW